MPCQGPVQVELQEINTAVGDRLPGQPRQALQQGHRFGPAMGLHHPRDHINASVLPDPRLLQHGVGLSHSRRGTEEHFQAGPRRPGFRLLHAAEQFIRA